MEKNGTKVDLNKFRAEVPIRVFSKEEFQPVMARTWLALFGKYWYSSFYPASNKQNLSETQVAENIEKWAMVLQENANEDNIVENNFRLWMWQRLFQCANDLKLKSTLERLMQQSSSLPYLTRHPFSSILFFTY
jgi:hypothetical protein